MRETYDPVCLERRQSAVDLSAADLFDEVPARSLMERLSIPLLAISDDGAVIIANDAFAELIGWAPTELAAAKCVDIFHDVVAGQGMLSFVGARAEQVVALCHRGGHHVYAKMTRSVLLRRDERAALVALTDVTELRWLGARSQ